MSLFIVSKYFVLNKRATYESKEFNKGKLYTDQDLKGTENTGMGDTLQEIVRYLERGGYIDIITDAKDILKSLLVDKENKR